MGKSSSDTTKKWREELKENEEKIKKYRIKEAERQRLYRRKMADAVKKDKKLLHEKRTKYRIRQQGVSLLYVAAEEIETFSSTLNEKLQNKTYPVLPSPGFLQLRFFNGIPDCEYKIKTNITHLPEISLQGIDYWYNQFIKVQHQRLTVTYTIQEDKIDCPQFQPGVYTFNESTAYSIFLQSVHLDQPLQIYEEQVEKSAKAQPLVRNLANMDRSHNIIWRSSKSKDIEFNQSADYRKIIELRATTYDVLIDSVKVHEQTLRHGGVYSLIIGRQRNGDIITKMIEVTKPNYMNILWLTPQYVVMTLGEVMFSVTGLEFSYSQSPNTMKSVLQACWLLAVAFGNVIVVIVAKLKFFDSQASEFFLFAGLMFVDMILFMWLAYHYKPNNPMEAPGKSQDVENTNRDRRQEEIKTTSQQARYTKRQMD